MAKKHKKGRKKGSHQPKSDERQLELFDGRKASGKHKRRHLKVGEKRRYTTKKGHRFVLEREE